jgi:ribosomal protein S18 acetylase RimI-like enzyme
MQETDVFISSIENNLYSLYDCVAKNTQCKHQKEDDYSFVNSFPYEWPSYFYRTCLKPDISGKILSEVSQVMKNKDCPQFLIGVHYEDNQEKAEANGFKLIMLWPGMYIDLDKHAPERNLDNGFTIKRVNTELEIDEWLKIASIGLFNGKKPFDTSFLSSKNKSSIQLFLGYAEENPVASALIHTNDNVSGLYMLSVLPEFRKRGIGRTMVNHTIRIARENKSKLLVLEANKFSFKLYNTLGFTKACDFDIYWKLY